MENNCNNNKAGILSIKIMDADGNGNVYAELMPPEKEASGITIVIPSPSNNPNHKTIFDLISGK